MNDFMKKLFWRWYFAIVGAPTSKDVDAKLAKIEADDEQVLRPQGAVSKCDCAVYRSTGEYITCYKNIENYKCHALAGGGIQTNLLPVGGCATLR